MLSRAGRAGRKSGAGPSCAGSGTDGRSARTSGFSARCERPLEEHRRQPRGPVLGVRPVRLRRLTARSDDLSPVQRDRTRSIPASARVRSRRRRRERVLRRRLSLTPVRRTRRILQPQVNPSARQRCKNAATIRPDELSRRLICPPASARLCGYGQAHRSPHRDRTRAPEGLRSRTRAGVLFGRARVRGDAAHGSVGGLSQRRRLPPSHRAEHLGEPATAVRPPPERPGCITSRSAIPTARRSATRSAACAPRAFRSTGRAITASARRSTSAIRTATGSSSTGIAHAPSGRGTRTARCR